MCSSDLFEVGEFKKGEVAVFLATESGYTLLSGDRFTKRWERSVISCVTAAIVRQAETGDWTYAIATRDGVVALIDYGGRTLRKVLLPSPAMTMEYVSLGGSQDRILVATPISMQCYDRDWNLIWEEPVKIKNISLITDNGKKVAVVTDEIGKVGKLVID